MTDRRQLTQCATCINGTASLSAIMQKGYDAKMWYHIQTGARAGCRDYFAEAQYGRRAP